MSASMTNQKELSPKVNTAVFDSSMGEMMNCVKLRIKALTEDIQRIKFINDEQNNTLNKERAQVLSLEAKIKESEVFLKQLMNQNSESEIKIQENSQYNKNLTTQSRDASEQFANLMKESEFKSNSMVYVLLGERRNSEDTKF